MKIYILVEYEVIEGGEPIGAYLTVEEAKAAALQIPGIKPDEWQRSSADDSIVAWYRFNYNGAYIKEIEVGAPAKASFSCCEEDYD